MVRPPCPLARSAAFFWHNLRYSTPEMATTILPRSEPLQPQRGELVQPSSPCKNILLGETDPDWQLIVADWIKEAGHKCFFSRDPAAICQLAHTIPADLIILDVAFACDGTPPFLEILTEKHPKVPVILYSAHNDDETGIWKMPRGAVAHVQKGYHKALLEAIERAIFP